MTATALIDRDSLRPRPPGGMTGGAVLALAVHLGLLAALAAATSWRAREPEQLAMAELWAAVPQIPAPRPAPPPPPPPAPEPPAPPPPPAPVPPAPTPTPPPAPAPAPAPRPDIALEQERQRQAEQQRRAEEQRRLETQRQAEAQRREREQAQRQAQAEQQRREQAQRQAQAEQQRREQAQQAERERRQREQAAAEERRLAQQREENLRRMMAQAGDAAPAAPNRGPTSEGAPSANYTARLVALIRSNIVFTGAVNAQAVAEVEVRAGPSGTILSRRLLKSSGQPDWDEAVLRAIDRTATLPRDENGRVPPELVIRFRPRE